MNWSRSIPLALLAGALLPLAAGAAIEPEPTLRQIREGKIRDFPAPPPEDLMILKDGYRMFALGRGRGWPGIKQVTPPTTLLVTEDAQYVMGHSNPPSDHFYVELPSIYFMKAYGRESDLPCDLATTRPLYGQPTIMIGSSTCRGSIPTEMSFEFTRLCFRLYLYSHRELVRAAQLDLPFPDPEEKWKTTIGFPYDDPEVIAAVRELGKVVSDIYWTTLGGRHEPPLDAYAPARERVREVLEARSSTYSLDDFFRFITWSEGVAHFAAFSIHKHIADGTSSEQAMLRRLPGWRPYRAYVGVELRRSLQRFRAVSDEPLTFDDLRILGSLTALGIDLNRDDFEPRIVANGVWLETLMAETAATN